MLTSFGRHFYFAVCIILMLTLPLASNASGSKPTQTDKYSYVPGMLIVKFKPFVCSGVSATNAAQSLQMKYGILKSEPAFNTQNLKKKIGVEELERVFVMSVSLVTDVRELAKRMTNEPNVEYAEPNYIIPVDKVPNDPLYSNVYPLSIVKASQAWDVLTGDSTVVVAILDTGTDWDHPDLTASIWQNKNEIPNNNIDDDNNGFKDDIRGWDFVHNPGNVWPGEDSLNADNNPMDFDGHGTHTAGIAGATTNNGVGIASLSWGIKVMPLRIGWRGGDGNGYGSTYWMSQAFIYAANNGASVANLSFGTSPTAVEGAQYAFRNGVVICNSAGNSNTEDVGLLGSMPWALSVASTNSNDNKASYSSYGVDVDVSAPGGDFSSGNRHGFLSTIVYPSSFFGGAEYVEFHGTSMASPFAASLAALIKSKNKTWNPAQIMFQIIGTADNIDAVNSNYIGKLGSGRINAYRAVTETPPAPNPKLEFVKVEINDVTGGNGNGILEPGENVKVIVTINNNWGDAVNLNATLSTTHWATTITKSASGYGTVPGITNIDANSKANTSDAFEISIHNSAVPASIPFKVTFNADGGYSKTFDFILSIGSRILLVDDDEGWYAEKYYTNDLQKLGVAFDYWNHSMVGTPSVATLAKYGLVIWMCEWAFPSLDSADRSSLKSYLDGGGKLFMTGQDIGWDMCDAAGGYPNEFNNSKGDSKTFYETYLKAKYLSDDALFSNLTGTAGDPISDGISFNREQPGRASSEQFPDVIDPLGGAVSIFKYTGGTYNGKAGAVRYDGSYKLVHFSFGGYEAITDSTIRLNVMNRVLRWFFGTAVADKLKDTENTTNPYTVTAQVTSVDAVVSVDLYWDTDGTMPFNKVAMSSIGGGKYQGSIPAQSGTVDVEYFVLARTSAAFLPYEINKFHVGPDNVAPIITMADTIQNSIRLNGPYPVQVTSTDNVGVDTNNVILSFAVNGGTESTLKLNRVGTSDIYTGGVIPPSKLKIGDVITYYITVKDIAAAKNTARFPTTGTRSFVIGKEMVDDFETQKVNFWNLGTWGYSTKYKKSGLYSIHDSPTGNYQPNSDNILSLVNGYDLRDYTAAQLRFYRRAFVDVSDTVYAEVTKDGSSWTTLKKINGNDAFALKTEFSDLTAYCGTGAQNVKLRFRLKSDAATESDGIYIDDIEILTGQYMISDVERISALVPKEFSLSQNYPNPFNPTTRISFNVPITSEVTLTVFDVVGREIASLASGIYQPGKYEATFDASPLSSGFYFAKLTAGTFTSVRKMLLIK